MIRTQIRPKTKVIQDYDRESPVYSLKRFSNRGGRYIDMVEKRLLAKHAQGPSLLEVGVATGRFIRFVRSMGWDYTGLDISAGMLRYARGLGGQLLLADGEAAPMKDSIFDTVICLHTFHFLPSPLTGLREFHRLLKPGGTLILIFEMDTWLRRLVLKIIRPVSNQFYFRIQEVAEMMTSSRFEVLNCGSVLELPMEAYRKLPMSPLQEAIDSSRPRLGILATLGYVVGTKRQFGSLPAKVIYDEMR